MLTLQRVHLSLTGHIDHAYGTPFNVHSQSVENGPTECLTSVSVRPNFTKATVLRLCARNGRIDFATTDGSRTKTSTEKRVVQHREKCQGLPGTCVRLTELPVPNQFTSASLQRAPSKPRIPSESQRASSRMRNSDESERQVEARKGRGSPESRGSSVPPEVYRLLASLLLAPWPDPTELTAEITQILPNLVLGDNAIRQRLVRCPAL